MGEYPEIRDLDGVYFRICREGKWKSISFTDMTEEEQSSVLSSMDVNQLTRMALIMATRLREVGDALDIYMEVSE